MEKILILTRVFKSLLLKMQLKPNRSDSYILINQCVLCYWSRVEVQDTRSYLFLKLGFTPFSTLLQFNHGSSSLMHDLWVNKPVSGQNIALRRDRGSNIITYYEYVISKSVLVCRINKTFQLINRSICFGNLAATL